MSTLHRGRLVLLVHAAASGRRENERSDGRRGLSDHGLGGGRQRCRLVMLGLVSVDAAVWNVEVDASAGDVREVVAGRDLVGRRQSVCSV